MAAPTLHVALVETSPVLPGLLPFQAWDVIGVADQVWMRDPTAHPSAPHLAAAGIEFAPLEPASLDRSDLDLNKPGSPEDRRIAKALVAHAAEQPVVYVLGPGDDGVAAALAGMAATTDVEIELVFFAQQPAGAQLLAVVDIMDRLRDPQSGCPWDLEQDHQSLVRYLVEETFELVDAIEHGRDTDIQEELGDVLLQVVFHARLAAERRAFGIDDVADSLVTKLIQRHPHVFGEGDAATADDVQERWDALKAVEKGRDSIFDGVPMAMPGLQLLDKIQGKAQAADPRWTIDDPESAIVQALATADSDQRIASLIAGVVALARRDGVDVERAARDEARRWRARVEEGDVDDAGSTAE